MGNLNLIDEVVKKNHRNLIISLIFLILMIILFSFLVTKERKDYQSATNMSSLVSNKEQKENIIAYLDIASAPYLFAETKVNNVSKSSKYYLVSDENNYLYIVYIPNKDYQKIKNFDYSEDNRIVGFTKIIPDEIKNLAIEAYNLSLGYKDLNEESFKENLGVIMLDLESLNTSYYPYYILIIIFFISFLIALFNYLINLYNNKKVLKNLSIEELQKIDIELYALKDNSYDKIKLYLTKNYIIDLSKKIVILKYEDIILTYKFEYRYSGLIVNKNIKLHTKEGKIYDICNTNQLRINQDEVIEEVISKIKYKNPDILIGNTLENKKIVKERLNLVKKTKN